MECTVIFSLFRFCVQCNMFGPLPVVIPFSKLSLLQCVCVCVSKSKKKKRGARKGDLLSISLSLLISYSILSHTGPTAQFIPHFFRFFKKNPVRKKSWRIKELYERLLFSVLVWPYRNITQDFFFFLFVMVKAPLCSMKWVRTWVNLISGELGLSRKCTVFYELSPVQSDVTG